MSAARTRAVEGLLARLADERDEIQLLDRRLSAARQRRQLLMVKASRAGLSTRAIGAVAGISSPGVSQSLRSYKPNPDLGADS